MIRTTAIALLLVVPLAAQDVKKPPVKPGWQERLEKASRSAETWKARREEIRRQILVAAGLYPEFERPPLRPDVFGKVDFDDYTIERVSLETLPGFYLTGSLYRPKGKKGPFPAILSPHGHWKEGRYTQEKDGNLPARGLTFARLGLVCFMYDMVGYGDFKQLPHKFDDAEWGMGLLGLQTWNSLRAVDFIAGLPDVDPKRIGATGASGGGTQTFLLAAIDDRIACAAPVNMVAAEFQGGCTCENAPFLRIGLNNVEIAAATAPRPLLLIAATGDWTKNVPTLEAPALEKAYQALEVPERFRAVQFTAPHNYNQDSREAVYAWMQRWLVNGHDAPKVEEPPVPPVAREVLAVWTPEHPLPANAVDAEKLRDLLRERITAQLHSLRPKDAASLKKYRDLMEPAWRTLLTVRPPAAPLGRPGVSRVTLVAYTNPEAFAPYKEAAIGRGEQVVSIDVGYAHRSEDPAGGDATQRKAFPTTFYRTELARQVQDILDLLGSAAAVGDATKVRLVGLGEAGLPVLLARAAAGSSVRTALTIVDLSTVDGALIARPHPGLNRLGGWMGAALLAPPGELVIHGKAFDATALKEVYQIAGRDGALTVSETPWAAEKIQALLAR
ncbi:MAG TPA: acetylxylan esterase [Planctomycetota bacterium]|nr:acetylxylan esterase [Planctomycetota bacterium]